MINSAAMLNESLKTRARDLGLRFQCGGDGDINATVAIIGEGPGQEEVNKELPFVGASGRLLWNSLRPYHIYRPSVYVTNVCKRQISLAKNSRYPVLKDEWIKWKHLLQWELAQMPNLRYILCMGNASLDALFGSDKVTNHRGSVYTYQDKQALITFNPAAVIREPKNEIVFLMDVRRFNDVVQGDFKQHSVLAHINPSFDQARDWIAHCKNSTAPVSWDIETIAGQTACHGLAVSDDEAMCINLRDRLHNRYSAEQELQLLFELQDLFDAKKPIAQNGNFDAHWCAYKDLLDVKIGFDTMLAHHTLYPILPHNLGFLTAQYTTHPYYKDEVDEFKEGGNINTFWTYNCKDAAITHGVAAKLIVELKEQKLYDFFVTHVMRLDPHLVRSTADGVRVDMSVKGEISRGMAEDVRKIEDSFHSLVQSAIRLGDDFRPNIRSNAQMRHLFLERLHLKSTTGSVDKDQRKAWLDDSRVSQDHKDIILKYDEFQRESKFFSTYAEMRVDPDNRFRTVWKQQGVTKAPGRLSSSGNLWGTASNAQNQPERSKKFFTSDDGTIFFYADGSQAEARLVAFLADIDKWKEDFERARLTGTYDAHRALAADMYKVPYDSTPSEDWETDPRTGLLVPTIRYKSKRARHGLNYRMQFMTLAIKAGLSVYEAKKVYIIYHQTNPEIKEWWDELEHIAKKERELWSPLGRRWRIMQRIDDEALESIVAFVPQSTVGDHVRRVWYKCHEDDEWDSRYMRIKLNVHDAVVGIATPEKAKTAAKIVQKHMEEPIMVENTKRTKVEQCIIPGDVAISEPDEFGIHRWSTLKKLKGFRWDA